MSPPTLHDQPADPFRVSSGDRGQAGDLPDLPPVEPPSAGFVVQFFVIPAAVVVVVIIVWLLFGKLAGGERDAMEYVRQLRSPTANWRLAFELASLIQHDAKIGSDPVLLGELTDLLSHELDQPDEDPKLTQYLALDAGGVPDSRGQDEERAGVDPLVPLARALSTKYQHRSGSRPPPAWQNRRPGWTASSKIAGAVKALGEAAATGEPEVRQMAVYALGFFGGNAAAELLRERVEAGRRSLRPLQRRRGACPSRRSRGGGHPSRDALDRRPHQGHRSTERHREAEQDRGDRARSDGGASDLDLERLARAGQVARDPDHRSDQIGTGQRSKPGARALAKFTKQALIYTTVSRPDRGRLIRASRAVLASSSRCASLRQAAEISQQRSHSVSHVGPIISARRTACSRHLRPVR